jgi:hypothetical protein
VTGWQHAGFHFTKPFAVAQIFSNFRPPTLLMQFTRNRYRIIYSALVILAFFLPAYSNVSAFGFLRMALVAAKTDAELTYLDVLVVLLPLLFIPLSATMILFRAATRRRGNGLLLALPLFFLAFFVFILSFDISRQLGGSLVSLVTLMRPGFYLGVLASLLLVLSYRRNETLPVDAGV